MKKLCGYDVNGWRDIAVRNWVLRPGEETVFERTEVDGGPLPTVVYTGDRHATWIGGPQAALAPHGRGDGWGEVGRGDRRLPVRDCLSGPIGEGEPLLSALRGLADGTDCGILAIDDTPQPDEGLQERLLAAASAARIRTRLLVWRPVLAALYAINRGIIRDELTVGIVSQNETGFATQILRIRRADGKAGDYLAPERRRVGQEVVSELGYSGLIRASRDMIGTLIDRGGDVNQSRAVGNLAFGLQVRPELLRLKNADWQELDPPRKLSLPTHDLARENFSVLDDCDLVLFETLCEGEVRDHAATFVKSVCSKPITILPSTAIADGGLVGAGRHCQGDPVYFDFLPRISTIVQSGHDVQDYPLISGSETLPAGRLYRSPKPARLALQRGQDRISIYLRKDLSERPRKAEVVLGAPIAEQSQVDLWVEQAPAAGRAKVVLDSRALSRQFSVDWETAEVLDESWDEIIAGLARPVPTIPTRLILPCGMLPWLGRDEREGQLDLFAADDGSAPVDWPKFAAMLSARPEKLYCISSDGELPPSLPEEAVHKLDWLTMCAMKEFRGQVSKGDPLSGDETAALKFLTWQFKRSPEALATILIDIANDSELTSRLLPHHSQRTLLFQGLGRIANKPALEEAALRSVLRRRIDEWSWKTETACVAFLLSRSDTAPLALTRKDVERLAKRVIIEFRDEHGGEYNRFIYAPFLLVGLLRWRLLEPKALVAGEDAVADRLMAAVDRALPDIARAARRKRNLEKYLKILEDCRAELQGKGSNQNLLLDIYNQ